MQSEPLKSKTILQNGVYRIEESIGEGGFSITYRGTQIQNNLNSFEETVAIKELFFEEHCNRIAGTQKVGVSSIAFVKTFKKFKEKFIEEANILTKLGHPQIVKAFDVFQENNTAYIVMNYIEGTTLHKLINKKGRLDEIEAIDYIKKIGTALTFVHQKDFLHLDIKPSNVIIKPNNEIVLIDFGIARSIARNKTSLTYTTRAFTKGYAAIEQYSESGRAKFKPATDIYGLSATLYTCLTGSVPTDAPTRINGELISPKEVNPVISNEISSAILKGMELKYENRFKSVDGFLKALEQSSELPVKPFNNEPLSQDPGSVIFTNSNPKEVLYSQTDDLEELMASIREDERKRKNQIAARKKKISKPAKSAGEKTKSSFIFFLIFLFFSLFFVAKYSKTIVSFFSTLDYSSLAEVKEEKYGNFLDERDDTNYKWAILRDGNKWITENVRYRSSGSWCYDNKPNNCDEYGRLYIWSAALDACPTGWHLPNNKEWKNLLSTYESKSIHQSGNEQESYKGGDTHKSTTLIGDSQFKLSFGGKRTRAGVFSSLNLEANFWSRTEDEYGWYFSSEDNNKAFILNSASKGMAFSCRCMEN